MDIFPLNTSNNWGSSSIFRRRSREPNQKTRGSLEAVYVREANMLYDCSIILRTLGVIIRVALGGREFADPPEMRKVPKVYCEC